MLYYLIAVNLTAFFAALSDKYRAVHQKRRISESLLFTLALLGGAAGEYISMRIFHHKTRHRRFMFGLPVIILAWILLLYAYKGLYL